MIKILSLLAFLFVGCTQSDAPAEWTDWTDKLHKKYKEKFSSPSIVHHIYLNSDSEDAVIKKTSAGYRLSKEACEDCLVKVKREPGLKLSLVNLKDKTVTAIEKEKETKVEALDSVFVTYYPEDKTDQIRVFIHDLKQEKLEKKRRRVFFPYKKDEIMVGTFNWLKEKSPITMSRSDGTSKNMNIVAKISYDHKGKQGDLFVYDYGSKDDSYKDQEKTMLMYRDLSSGKSTYGAGRFLSLNLKKKLGDIKDGETVSVDLNFSYNPPCAVSTGFHCPLPQNTIDREVLAGEKYSK